MDGPVPEPGPAPGIGDEAKCADCGRDGVVVSDGPATPIKTDRLPLEPSAYGAHEVVCTDCEGLRFRGALPRRGRCLNCGDPVPDSVASKSFCDDDCQVEFDARNKTAP